MGIEKFDLMIIGGGPGGYVAAIRAAQLGLKTAVVEKNHLGGVCLNWGCIPTKALLKCAEIYHQTKHLQEFGIKVSNISLDLSQMVARSRKISETLSRGVSYLMKKNNVTVLEGHASLQGKKGELHQVLLTQAKNTKATLEAPRIILATGARPDVLKGFELDGEILWTAHEAMIPKTLPRSLVVIGSGAIGLEFSSFYNMLGTQVHLVEHQKKIFPIGDHEVSDLIHKSFEKRGIIVHTETTAVGWKKEKTRATVSLKTPKGSQEIKADHILLATGIVGNIENLGLENTQIKTERTHIVTRGICETHESGIYAIGDVADSPWLAHKASHEGILCVDHIVKGRSEGHALSPALIPSCVYSFPQIASIGLTENQARTQGNAISVGRFPFTANGKALTQGETEGFVKVIFDQKTGEILGAHLVGPEVTELICNFSLAKTLEATEEDVAQCVFPHPTLSESLLEAILNGLGRGLHL